MRLNLRRDQQLARTALDGCVFHHSYLIVSFMFFFNSMAYPFLVRLPHLASARLVLSILLAVHTILSNFPLWRVIPSFLVLPHRGVSKTELKRGPFQLPVLFQYQCNP
jgi:hypothetical protein